MLVIRPITTTDYPALMQIAHDSGIGFTSLPTNEDILRSRIEHSKASFSLKISQPGSESYLLVMEDTDTGEIVGTSGLEAAVGRETAFYSYHLGKVVHSSKELGIHNMVNTLTLCNHYTDSAEICTLFLKNKARVGNNGRVLSRFRFLFLAEFMERFSKTVIAEMRGVSSTNGSSPFWKWLQEHFFGIDFKTADYLIGTGNKTFIAELMPRHPIYVNLLSQEAQDVIGKVHEKTLPALKLLQREGFVNQGYFDIFDAGPTVECELEQIESVKNSLRLQVKIAENVKGTAHIICNTTLTEFRATEANIHVDHENDFAVLNQQYANTLKVKEGDYVRVLAL